MRTNKTRLCAIVLLIMVVALMLLGSCNDNPTKPIPEEELDYVFYMHEGFNPGYIFAYYPNTNHVDSFWLPVGVGFHVSADGKFLYARPSDSVNSAVYLLDSISNGDTLQIDHMLPFYVTAVSPNNQFLAVVDDGFSIVSTTDYSVIFRDTSIIVGGVFTADGQRYYGGELHVNLQGTPEIIRRWSCPFGPLYDFVPNEDESIWYLMVSASGFFDFLFVVYDPETDSVLYSQYLTPGIGHIKLAPDGKVFFTNPGTGPFSSGPFPPPFFHVYDPETNTANDTIWTLNKCSQMGATPIGELAITPDGRLLVGIHSGFGEILTFNLATMQYEKCYSLGPGHSLRALSCQQIP